jgi:uncharacterized membrane protein
MNFLKSSAQRENRIEATKILLSALKAKVTDKTVENDLLNHPDYPALLSVTDALNGYGIENLAFTSSIDKITEIPTPFLAQIKGQNSHNDRLTVVLSVRNDVIRYYNPDKLRMENVGREYFAKKWVSGLVVIVDPEKARPERDYRQKRWEERRLGIAKIAAYFSPVLWVLVSGVLALLLHGAAAAIPVVYLVTFLLGGIIGGLLLWYELDQYNPVLKQLCSVGPKVNCGAILTSKASKVGGISWSVIGFIYFTGGLFSLIFNGVVNIQVLCLLAWINILAVPYVIFSVFYQWRVAKQWCLLCLSVQALLVTQLAISMSMKWISTALLFSGLNPYIIITVGFSYLLSFIFVTLLLPAYQNSKGSQRNGTELRRFKHNQEIFQAMLAKQRSVTESTTGLGITIGNPNGKIKILQVCNPYCGACSGEHLVLEDLLSFNSDIQVQIIFTASARENDSKSPPVKHLMAIAESNNEILIRKALNDWYVQEEKNYSAFAAKYPMNGELKRQDAKVEAMREWCDKTVIMFTPTFFISLPSSPADASSGTFHELPQLYRTSELKYFLSV